MPINRTTHCANVHLLVWLNFSPAELAVSNEGLIFIDLLGRQLAKVDDFPLVNYIHYLFSATGTGRMMPPPLY
jgi:hypothetical protein